LIASEVLTTSRTLAARQLHRLLRSSGGFTIDHGTGDPLDRGVAVCADPDRAWSFMFDEWHDDDVARWIDDQHPRLAEGDVHLGGWLQRELGTVWLELVWVLPNRLQPAAMALGRLHDQHAVFDLRRSMLVRLEPSELTAGAR
jgi:hypothetical protein